MFKTAPTAFIVILTLSLLSGCATTWDQSQRAALNRVGIGSITAAPGSYHRPDASKSPSMSQSLPMATGGGVLPYLIGAMIDANVTAQQQKSYEARAGRYFDELKVLAEQPPVGEVRTELEKTLRMNSFTGPRYSDHPSEKMDLVIRQHGFTRAPTTTSMETRLQYHIGAHVSLITQGKGDLLNVEVMGQSGTSARIDQLFRSPELIADMKLEAASNLARHIDETLTERATGKPAPLPKPPAEVPSQEPSDAIAPTERIPKLGPSGAESSSAKRTQGMEIDYTQPLGIMTLGCSGAYNFARDCNFLTGPNRRILVAGLEYDLAATSDGSVIMAMGGMSPKEPSYYEPLASLMLHSGFKLRLVRPITCCGKLSGIVIESSPGAYDQLLGAIAGDAMSASPRQAAESCVSPSNRCAHDASTLARASGWSGVRS